MICADCVEKIWKKETKKIFLSRYFHSQYSNLILKAIEIFTREILRSMATTVFWGSQKKDSAGAVEPAQGGNWLQLAKSIPIVLLNNSFSRFVLFPFLFSFPFLLYIILILGVWKFAPSQSITWVIYKMCSLRNAPGFHSPSKLTLFESRATPNKLLPNRNPPFDSAQISHFIYGKYLWHVRLSFSTPIFFPLTIGCMLYALKPSLVQTKKRNKILVILMIKVVRLSRGKHSQ